MHEPDQSELEINGKELASAFEGVLSWKWDTRFDTALAEFRADNRDVVYKILSKYLHNTWDSLNIDHAPEVVQNINIHIGKMRAGQLLLTSDTNSEAFIYCAWWPWGNGKTISVRIAPFYKTISGSEKASKIRAFKSWFGI